MPSHAGPRSHDTSTTANLGIHNNTAERALHVVALGRKNFLFAGSNVGGGLLDPGNYRNRVFKPLAEALELPKLAFQVLRRTMATRAQNLGSVKDIQAHLRHLRADTTANEYMQELPETVQQMVGTVYAMLTNSKVPEGVM